MKTLKSLFVIAFFSLFLISCKKDSDNGNNNNNAQMSAKVDGAAWNADLATTGSISGTSPQVLSIGGTGSQGQINLVLGNYTGVGVYNIGIASPSTFSSYTLTSSPFTSYSASAVLGSGRIEVTSASATRVEGTFYFSGKDNNTTPPGTKEITEGTFRIDL